MSSPSSSETLAEFDWWLLEYLADNDPISPDLLTYEVDRDRTVIDERLEFLRERGLAHYYFSSRPTQWGITDEGRECLSSDLDGN